MTLPELLKKTVELEGSDLHITINTPPQVRVHGHLQRLEGGDLTPSDTKALTYSVLTDSQKKRFEEALELDFSFGIKGLARFRCNMFNQRGAVGCRLPIDSGKDPQLPGARTARGAGQPRRAAARPRARHRSDRQRQVDDARRDDRQDQSGAEGSHPHHRGSDRIHPSAQGMSRQPARGAQRHAELLDGAARRAARRPRHRSHRRAARPRDRRSGAAHRRDGPLDVRHAAHQLRGADDQPHHRRLSRASAEPDPDAAVARARRDRLPGAAAEDSAAAASVRWRS